MPRADKSALGESGRTTATGQEWFLAADALLLPAAHIIVSRTWYAHHGIHVGEGKVVHYRGLSRGWQAGPVEEVSLAEFSRGRRIRVRSHDGGYSIETVVARARSRLGEDSYRLLSNNCEHFCEWCTHGRNRSLQIEQWLVRRCPCVGAGLNIRSYSSNYGQLSEASQE